MIHGIGCDGTVFNRMAAQFAARGFLTRTPTIFPSLRTTEAPSPALAQLSFQDYVDAMAEDARAFAAETGRPLVLLGHSMGGLIVQKLAARGMGALGVLVTPAAPADCHTTTLSQILTFWNIAQANDIRRSFKVWRTGFYWGVLNAVPRGRRAEIYANAVYDGGRIYRDVGRPHQDPNRTAFIDAADVKIPLLTVCAGRDRATPPASVRRTAAKYRGSGGQILEYPRSGHWIVDEPATDRMVGDIATWVKRKLDVA